MLTICLEEISRESVSEGSFKLRISEVGDVELSYFEVFDRATGEYDSYYGTFPREGYRRGLRELKERKECCIQGNNCQLEITRKNSHFEIYFSTPNKSIAITQKSIADLLYLVMT